jgi:hypothetical protein
VGRQLESLSTTNGFYFKRIEIYTANGLELDFYVSRNFADEIQPRQGLNLNSRSSLCEIRARGETSHRYTQVFWILGTFMTSTTDTRNKRIKEH